MHKNRKDSQVAYRKRLMLCLIRETKGFALFSLLILLVSVNTSCKKESPDDQNGNRSLLSSVNFWAYQIDSLDHSGSIDALVQSRYDLIVMDQGTLMRVVVKEMLRFRKKILTM